MEKIKIKNSAQEARPVKYGGVEFNVDPFLTLAKQTLLINRYIEEYFTLSTPKMILEPEYAYFEAELSLRNYILQMNTDIDTENLSNDIYVDSRFWEAVFDEIYNYKEFREKLDRILSEIKEERSPIAASAKILSDLYTKVSMALDSLSEMNPEELKKAQEEMVKTLERFEQSAPLVKKAGEQSET